MHAALIANSACAPWLAAACRMTWPDSYKALAGWVWRAAHGRLSSAVRAFRNQVAAAKMELPRDVAQYVAIWGPRLRDDGTIASCASNSGAKRKLTNRQVDTCFEEAIAWHTRPCERPYGSMQELVEENQVVRGIVQAAGCSAALLFQRMKERHPSFGYRLVAKMDILTPQHKQQRLAACKQMLRMTLRQLQLVIWIDAKSMILTVEKQRAWVDIRDRDFVYRMRPPQAGNQIINLKYYIAVSPLLGPLWLRFYTGTTGMTANRDGRAYKVRLMHY